MANVLSRAKQGLVMRCLVDGASVRATERITSVHRDTILRLMVRIGEGCQRLMDREMRGLTCQRIQVDEIGALSGRSNVGWPLVMIQDGRHVDLRRHRRRFKAHPLLPGRQAYRPRGPSLHSRSRIPPLEPGAAIF